MPETPEHRDIEKLLRAYGRKRQEKALPEAQLHPATRRLLLDEVRRVYGRAPAPTEPVPQSWLQWLTVFWPRVGVAAALFFLLGGVIWMSVRDQRPSTQLARAEKVAQQLATATVTASKAAAPSATPAPSAPQTAPTASEPTAPSPAPTTVPAPTVQAPSTPARSVSRARPSPAQPTLPAEEAVVLSSPAAASVAEPGQTEDRTPAASRALAQKPSQPTAQPKAGALLAEHVNTPKVLPVQSSAVVSAATAEQPTEVAPPDLKADTALALEPTRSQLISAAPAAGLAGQAATMFKNLADAAATSLSTDPKRIDPPAPAPRPVVLETFSLVQIGNEIRIEDNDGSVYAGRVLDAPASAETVTGRTGTPLPSRTPTRVAFQARGTNRTLKELVVIEAALDSAPRTNQFFFGATQTSAATQQKGAITSFSALDKVQVPLAQPRLVQIEGTARVGSRPPILLRAVRQQP